VAELRVSGTTAVYRLIIYIDFQESSNMHENTWEKKTRHEIAIA
jgi:hypothetical protein